jgi:hypothetical protein
MVFVMVFGPFHSIIVEDEYYNTFFAGKNEDQDQRHGAVYGAVVVSMVFGGIHCTGWLLSFPSHTEQLLWRISSVAITGVPFFFVVYFFTADDLPDIVTIPIIILYILSPILYLFPASRCWFWLSWLYGHFPTQLCKSCNGLFLYHMSRICFCFALPFCNNISHSYHFASICQSRAR